MGILIIHLPVITRTNKIWFQDIKITDLKYTILLVFTRILDQLKNHIQCNPKVQAMELSVMRMIQVNLQLKQNDRNLYARLRKKCDIIYETPFLSITVKKSSSINSVIYDQFSCKHNVFPKTLCDMVRAICGNSFSFLLLRISRECSNKQPNKSQK